MPRFEVSFEGFDEILAKLKRLDANTKEITEKSLKATHSHITPRLHTLMARHRRTGKTEESIRETADIEWAGNIASVPVGFNIRNGGLPSIFLMYGTPRMNPDTALYNAIYGNSTKNEVSKIQEDIFYEALRELER